MMKAFLKHLAAIALGGALSGLAGANIDPNHMGGSLKDLGKLAGAGALGAVITLNMRAPKDE
jgi:hypothetical protein